MIIIKEAITQSPIDSLISQRWSCRAFDINKPVSREQISAICEAGRWAPSCNGEEPWRFIYWDRNYNEDAFDRAFNCLTEGNKDGKECSRLVSGSSRQ